MEFELGLLCIITTWRWTSSILHLTADHSIEIIDQRPTSLPASVALVQVIQEGGDIHPFLGLDAERP